ncbi:hypothetical protein Trco_004499 [Trichoderma cornu-damae]|uniref:Uncharacterized protein n=1 Tax=Trichoderma cornu-damae TaxID=654480 RepID=A0A9P8QKW3_9HYPO|nr:hypothetical protein Trco_004499 [Trichoderma cornu-damae]
MPGSSTNAVHGSANASNESRSESHAAAPGGTRARIPVPDDRAYSMSRFLCDGVEGSTPPGFREAQSQAEAEHRMAAQLHALEAKFNLSGHSGGGPLLATGGDSSGFGV